MSVNHFLMPILIPIDKSRQLRRVIGFVYTVFAVLICLVEIQDYLFKVLILLSLYISYRITKYSLERFSGDKILFDKKNQFHLIKARSGGDQKLVLSGAGFVHPLITILCFRLDSGSRLHVCLLCDNVDPDSFRRLRVRLRGLTPELIGL